jgi:5-methylcytosine-specific restriction endonuclease McrA
LSRKEFSVKTKKAALKRANGKCEGCEQPLKDGGFHFDHAKPDGLSGNTDLENCQVLCVGCHKLKTREDTKIMRKADAQRAIANNLKPPKQKIPYRKPEKRMSKPSLPPRPMFTEGD